MKALMMNMPPMISSLILNADRRHGYKGIVSRFAESDVHRTCANDHKRLRRVAVDLFGPGARPCNQTTLEQHAWI